MHIDLNADLGEGAPSDQDLLALISSASICCGVHAGDADTISRAILHARTHGVRLGAHPSFPDREHGGRSAMELSFSQLRNHLLYQLGALDALVRAQDAQLAYVKPHGALYNQAAADRQLAEDLVVIVREFDPALALMGLAGSELCNAAQNAGLPFIAEAFVDRRYNARGGLLPRSDKRALIRTPQLALAQALDIVRKGTVNTVDGDCLRVHAQTLCLHGDTPDAPAFARALREAFAKEGIAVRAGEL
jgi:UPF0271 protein